MFTRCVQSLSTANSLPEHAYAMLHLVSLPRAPGWLRAACVAAACMTCGERPDSVFARSACLHSTYISDAFLRCGHTDCAAAIRQVYNGACMQSMHVPLPSRPPCMPSRGQHQLLSSVRQQLAVQEQGYEVAAVACSAGKRDVVINSVPIALSATDASTMHAQVSLMRVGDSVLLPIRPTMPHRFMILSMLYLPAPGRARARNAFVDDQNAACAALPLLGWQLRAEVTSLPGPAVPEPENSGESTTSAAPPGSAPRVLLRNVTGREVVASANVGFVPEGAGALAVARAMQALWDLHDRKNMPHLQPADYKGLHAQAWPCCKKLRFPPDAVKTWEVSVPTPAPEGWATWLAQGAGALVGKSVIAFACIDLE